MRLDSFRSSAGVSSTLKNAQSRLSGRPSPLRQSHSGPDTRQAPHLEWLRPYGRSAAAVLLLAIVAAGLDLSIPLFMRYMVDQVLLNRALPLAARFARLQLAGLACLIVVLTSNGLSALKEYRQRTLNVRFVVKVRRLLFGHLLHLPFPTLSELRTGGILSRLTGDVDATSGLLQQAFVLPTIASLRVVIAVTVLVGLNWRLALAAVGVIPGALLISFAFSRRIRPIYRSLRHDVEQIDARAGEVFAGIRVVRSFRAEMRELIAYVRHRHSLVRKELFVQRRELLLWTSWSVFLATVNLVIVWYGGYLNLRGRASIGDILAFQAYTLLLLNPMWSIVNSVSEVQRALAASDRVAEVLALPLDMPDRRDAREAPHVVREIQFQSVAFAYRDNCPVLRDVSIVVPGGSLVALVGRSGAGKTTLTDLLARFYDPTTGRILVNGFDIRDFRLRSYRQLVSIVPQDIFLFDGSVHDNIAYGRENASAADVESAARHANAHEFIERLPNGYDTLIGERGVKLSAGQRQRLAIARAILVAPQILVLDEATSNVDTESERLIQASLASLFAGRTTFVIAHRLSTVRKAHLILVIENGQIVEHGSHDNLLRAHGLYHTMVMREFEFVTGAEDGLLA